MPVSFMNLGRGISHGITLRHIEGELLDRTGPYPLAETVKIGLTINGRRTTAYCQGIVTASARTRAADGTGPRNRKRPPAHSEKRGSSANHRGSPDRSRTAARVSRRS